MYIAVMQQYCALCFDERAELISCWARKTHQADSFVQLKQHLGWEKAAWRLTEHAENLLEKVIDAGPRSVSDLCVPCHMFACCVACTAIVSVCFFFSTLYRVCDSSDNYYIVTG